MRLPNDHTCPDCKAEFTAGFFEMLEPAFRCPACASPMQTMKAHWRRFVHHMDVCVIISNVYKQTGTSLDTLVEDEEDKLEAICSKCPITVDDICRFLMDHNIGTTIEKLGAEKLREIVHQEFATQSASRYSFLNRITAIGELIE